MLFNCVIQVQSHAGYFRGKSNPSGKVQQGNRDQLYSQAWDNQGNEGRPFKNVHWGHFVENLEYKFLMVFELC